jgi:TPR repeat protein
MACSVMMREPGSGLLWTVEAEAAGAHHSAPVRPQNRQETRPQPLRILDWMRAVHAAASGGFRRARLMPAREVKAKFIVMRINGFTLAGLVATAALWGGPQAWALDAKSQAPAAASVPVEAFKSTKDAFKTGIKDYNAGDKTGAVKALEYAAQQGHALARWKLGRMYADGDGVPQDDLKAFEHFSRIADENADESPDAPNARFVASAFVALGSYYLDGIPQTYVKPNAERAREMFQYAASYFGDPDAQYSLARLQMDGVGGAKDARQAMRWLNLAAEKGHVQAQALLGNMLFTGEGGVRQRARGLMWLTIARDAAVPDRDAWVLDLYNKAFAEAADTDRQAALAYLEQQIRRKN